MNYAAVGGVGVGGADVAVGAVEFADVLGEIPTVSVPGSVFLNGQRAGGGGDDPRVIRLREYKSIHTHGFGGDITHGQGVVQGTFRANMILYPLR